MAIDLTAIVTFHNEGILAHATLRSYLLSRNRAQASGVSVQMILLLDYADAATSHIVRNHPDLDGTELILDISVGDCGLGRNLGVAHASGIFVCTLAGYVLISRDYFQRHVEFARTTPGRLVLHAEIVVSFGATEHFSHQVDQRSMPFTTDMLMTVNPWISAVFARKDVFETLPYVACFPRQTGFGFEDWHWGCQTTAAGYEHLVVPGTAYFYRVKQSGSMNQNSSALQAVIPPTDLFGTWRRS